MSGLFYVSYAALWVLLLVLGVFVLLLYRHFGMMALGTAEGVQRDGLPIGAVAPDVRGITAEGAPTTWTPGGQPALLLFATPGCTPCATVLPAVNRLAMALNGRGVAVAAVVPGRREDAAKLVETFDLRFPCLAEDGSGVTDRYRVRVSPFAFVIGQDGRVLAKGLCSDAERLRALLAAGGLEDAAAALEPTIQLVVPNGRRRGAMAEAKEEVPS